MDVIADVASGLASAFFYLLPNPTSTTLRTLGGFFELGGLALVAWGIYNLHQQFGGEPLPPEIVTRFLKRNWRRLTGRVEHHSVAAQLEIQSSVHAHGVTQPTLTPGAKTLEEKVAWLMQSVNQLQKEDARLEKRIEAERRERTELVQKEEQVRAELVEELRSDIETLATGDLNRQFWGVMAFGFGIILQVWATEIARWL
jgi:hypothetical protein